MKFSRFVQIFTLRYRKRCIAPGADVVVELVLRKWPNNPVNGQSFSLADHRLENLVDTRVYFCHYGPMRLEAPCQVYLDFRHDVRNSSPCYKEVQRARMGFGDACGDLAAVENNPSEGFSDSERPKCLHLYVPISSCQPG